MKKLLFMAIASVMLFSSCEKDPIIPPVDTVLVGTLTENKTLTADKDNCLCLEVIITSATEFRPFASEVRADASIGALSKAL